MNFAKHHIVKFNNSEIIVVRSRRNAFNLFITAIFIMIMAYMILLYPFQYNNDRGIGKLGLNFAEYEFYDWILFFSPFILISPFILYNFYFFLVGEKVVFKLKSKLIYRNKKLIGSFSNIYKIIVTQSQDVNISNKKNIQLMLKILLKNKKIKIRFGEDYHSLFKIAECISVIANVEIKNESQFLQS